MATIRRIACALLLMAPVVVMSAIDLTDFDEDVMRTIDDTYKDLEPVIGASNANAAKENIEVLKEGYQWTLEYFTLKKEEAPDAVEITIAGQKALADIEAAVNAKDFGKAAELARGLDRNCKSCHEKYKPKTPR